MLHTKKNTNKQQYKAIPWKAMEISSCWKGITVSLYLHVAMLKHKKILFQGVAMFNNCEVGQIWWDMEIMEREWFGYINLQEELFSNLLVWYGRLEFVLWR